MKYTPVFALAATIALSMGSFRAVAQTHSHDHAAASALSGTNLTDGEVRKIDKDQGKVTIRHGEIKNLDMPAMTMVFKVQSPEMLKSVKVGDAVKFRVEKINGGFTVTAINKATP